MSEQLQRAIKAFAGAIARAEGFTVPGSIPAKANNPGDLVRGDQGLGTLGAAKITIYQTLAEGWEALDLQVAKMFTNTSHVYRSSMTIEEVANHYTTTQQSEWAQNVAEALHVSPKTTLDEVLAQA